ncbi:MAG: AI-2E family transporter [Aaplasma endosymbiont of Hyalomma asiaticum]
MFAVRYVNYILAALMTVVILVVMRPVLCSCSVAVIVAYLFNPLVNRMEKIGFSRMVSSFVIILTSTGAVGTLAVLLMPILYSQALDIVKLCIDRVPFINLEDLKRVLSASGIPVYKDIVDDVGDPISFIKQSILSNEHVEFFKVFQNASSYFGRAIVGIAHSSVGVGSSIIKVLTTFVLSFYILGHWPVISRAVFDLVPKRYLQSFSDCVACVDEIISTYLRGQTLVCLVMACYYCFCFMSIGLEYSLVLGLISGMMTFIPYVGPVLCAILSICIAISQGLGMGKAIMVLSIMFTVGQTIESNLITPAIVGKRLSLCPAWLIIGMVVLSSHIGFFGALLSVPLTAILKVLTEYVVSRYTISAFYLRK